MDKNWKKVYDQHLLDFPINFDKARELKAEHLPTLFKYKSFDTSGYWKELILGSVCLVPPSHFNDPFDCLLSITNDAIFNNKVGKQAYIDALESVYSFSDKELGKLTLSNNITNTMIDILEKRGCKKDRYNVVKSLNIHEFIGIKNVLRNIVRVTCFSEVNDSILMWSHYANNHSGFCIEYDFHTDELMDEFLYPVTYSTKRVDLSSHFLNAEQWISPALLIKAFEWNYEKEWRFFNASDTSDNVLYDVSKCIKAVYLGATVKEEDRNALVELLKGKGIALYEMALSKNEYKLIPCLLTQYT